MRIQDVQHKKDQLVVETSDMLHLPLFTAEALLRTFRTFFFIRSKRKIFSVRFFFRTTQFRKTTETSNNFCPSTFLKLFFKLFSEVLEVLKEKVLSTVSLLQLFFTIIFQIILGSVGSSKGESVIHSFSPSTFFYNYFSNYSRKCWKF